MGLAAAVVANVLVIGVLGFFGGLAEADGAAFHRSLHPGGSLAWTSAVAFALAASVWALTARERWRVGARAAGWVLLAAVCGLLAGEQLAWGQHVVGASAAPQPREAARALQLSAWLPPGLLNTGILLLLGGYGVALPLLAGGSRRESLAQAGVPVLPLALAPAFLAAASLVLAEPWLLTIEVVELMLGLGLLFAGLAALRREAAPSFPAASLLPAVVTAWGISVGCGLLAARVLPPEGVASSAYLTTARLEIDALAEDFRERMGTRGPRVVSRCGTHSTLRRYARHRGRFLHHGAFAALHPSSGVSRRRGRLLLDPWEAPYWIQHACDASGEREVLFLYSKGPDGRADGEPWKPSGDDIRAVLSRKESPAGPVE